VFDAIRGFLDDLLPLEGVKEIRPRVLDTNLASAVLMVQVIVADGKTRPEEEARLLQILEQNYDLSAEQAKALAELARETQGEAIDLYGFTSLLKRDMNEDQRLGVVEDLWEMVFADGELHEFEDNVVWRIAELLGVSSRSRMELKQRVRSRLSGAE